MVLSKNTSKNIPSVFVYNKASRPIVDYIFDSYAVSS